MVTRGSSRLPANVSASGPRAQATTAGDELRDDDDGLRPERDESRREG